MHSDCFGLISISDRSNSCASVNGLLVSQFLKLANQPVSQIYFGNVHIILDRFCISTKHGFVGNYNEFAKF